MDPTIRRELPGMVNVFAQHRTTVRRLNFITSYRARSSYVDDEVTKRLAREAATARVSIFKIAFCEDEL